jgi:SAM-dependent methyltransferase
MAASEDVDIELLNKAWKIPTGGAHAKPYYSIDVDGHHFSGERSWDARWSFIQDAMDYRNARVLELGCNVGLASTYLLKYKEAASATGVDRLDYLLAQNDMPRLMEAAKLIHQAFGVHVNLVQTDINSSDYEDLLGNDYDVVFCMSFLKWVQDKERLLDYLSTFRNVIFEGHESDEVEIERFAQRGFRHVILGKTQVGVSYPSDATRTVIYFYK